MKRIRLDEIEEEKLLESEAEDEDIYSEDEREDQIENDQLSPEEEAFMKGWDEAS